MARRGQHIGARTSDTLNLAVVPGLRARASGQSSSVPPGAGDQRSQKPGKGLISGQKDLLTLLWEFAYEVSTSEMH
jgi:hypothetical protein